MKFLEKDLETIIYENKNRLGTKGLNLDFHPCTTTKLLRQVRLGCYGVADLVHLEVFNREKDPNRTKAPQKKRVVLVTVIECKLNVIDINAYAQAKRYITAIKQYVKQHRLHNTQVLYRSILIGNEVCTKGDFAFVHSNDTTCDIYTYRYGFNGIEFTRDGKLWSKGDASDQPQLLSLTKPLFKHLFEYEVLSLDF